MLRDTLCGIVDCLALEMVEKEEHDYAVDNWTSGNICYECLFGVPPYKAEY